MNASGSVASRQADLDFVVNQLPKLHVDFFFQLDPAQYQQAAAEIAANLATVTDAEFYVRLAALIAMPGDPHTHLYLGGPAAAAMGFQQFPLLFRWLDDGVFVVGAAPQYSQALGAQLIRIGDSTVDDVMAKLGTIIPHANVQFLRSYSQQDLRVQQILQGLNVLPATATSSLTFRDRAGQEFTLQVGTEAAAMLGMPDSTQGTAPLYLRGASQNYWYTYSARLRLLYIKYNSCTDMPGYPFTKFAGQVLATLDANPVDTFVLDFRGNGGGSDAVAAPLFEGLNERLPAMLANPNIRIYDVIDKGTFSAAVDNAMMMKSRAIEAAAKYPDLGLDKLMIVIGEPTGGAPSGYGNVLPFTLPGSKLTGQYSTTVSPQPPNIPLGTSFMPDVPVSIRSSDYFARYDPVLADILARWPGPAAPLSGDVIAVNAATFRSEHGIAPGSLAVAFGSFGATTDGIQVNGKSAPVLAAGPSQVNFVVPTGAAPGPATISARAGGVEIARGEATITAASPGIFVLQPADPSQPGAVLNQDSSVNSKANPAEKGSVIQIFATGNGALDSNGQALVQVLVGESPAAVLYSAPVPQFAGLWQINARVPDDVSGQAALFLIAGNTASNGVTIWLH
jgi:uncharacterized protein (TIGR03437 family)